MAYNSAIIAQQKIKLLLLCRKYKKDMVFPMSFDVNGRVDVLYKHLPSDTCLLPMLADEEGYSSVGTLNPLKHYGCSNDALFLPCQTDSLTYELAYNYGYDSFFGYKRRWISAGIFDSEYDAFPDPNSSDEEKERAILLMLEYFCMGVFQNDKEQEEYIEEMLQMYDEASESEHEDVRCNLEEALWVGENIYRFYKGEWSWEKICCAAKDFIREYVFFDYEDTQLREELLVSISNIVPLFIELAKRARNECLENTFFSLIKFDNVGELMSYFEKHPYDERKNRFLDCLSFFERFHSTGDCEFAPIWCRDTEKNLYVCFLSGSDLKETTDFNEMDSDFLVVMQELQFLYEEIF